MRWGISSVPCPPFVPFATQINAVCQTYPMDFPPCFLAAIKCNETGNCDDPAQLQDGADPQTCLLPDGSAAGRGCFQLTASWPADWADPYANAKYALDTFLAPAVEYWVSRGLTGDALIKCAAASYNAGLTAAIDAHAAGDVDKATTNNYGARAVRAYHELLVGRMP